MKICVFRSYKSRHIVSPYVSTNSQKSYPGCFFPTRVGALHLHMLPATVRTRTLVFSFLHEQAHCISIRCQQQSELVPCLFRSYKSRRIVSPYAASKSGLVPWLFRFYKCRRIVSPYAASNSQDSYPGCFVPTRAGALHLHMLPATVRTRALVVSFLQE